MAGRLAPRRNAPCPPRHRIASAGKLPVPATPLLIRIVPPHDHVSTPMLHLRRVSGPVKRLLLRLAILALLVRPALAGGSERQPDDSASGTPSATVTATEPGSDLALSPNLMSGLFVGSALFSLTLHLALRHHRRSVGQLDRVRRKEHLMTAAERDFLAVLEPLVRSVCHISIKVRLTDLFEIRPERGRQSAYHLVSNHHVGFILNAHETGQIVCGIELLVSSRQLPDGAKRAALVDHLFASQQIPLFRFPGTHRYAPEALRETLTGILGLAPAG